MSSVKPAHHYVVDIADPNDPLRASRSAMTTNAPVSCRDERTYDNQAGENEVVEPFSRFAGSLCSAEYRSTSRSRRTRNDLHATYHGPRGHSRPTTRHERSSGGVSTDRHPRGESVESAIREKVTDRIDRAAARFSTQNGGPRATFRSISNHDSCSIVSLRSLPSMRGGGFTSDARNRGRVLHRIAATLEAQKTYAQQRTSPAALRSPPNDPGATGDHPILATDTSSSSPSGHSPTLSEVDENATATDHSPIAHAAPIASPGERERPSASRRDGTMPTRSGPPPITSPCVLHTTRSPPDSSQKLLESCGSRSGVPRAKMLGCYDEKCNRAHRSKVAKSLWYQVESDIKSEHSKGAFATSTLTTSPRC